MNYFRNSCRRINAIKFDNMNYSKKISDLNLLKEYMRRVANLMMGYPNEPLMATLFFNVERVFNYEIEDEEIKKYINISEIKYAHVDTICMMYLKFSYILDLGDKVALKYKDLFEPIIKLYERGVIFRVWDVGILTGIGICPIAPREYLSKQKEIDITDDALLNYDKVNKME